MDQFVVCMGGALENAKQEINEHCKRLLADQEERLVLIEEICIDTGALVLMPLQTRSTFFADHDGYKNAYVTVFQAWAKGTIKGTAEQIFEATKFILEGLEYLAFARVEGNTIIALRHRFSPRQSNPSPSR